jgi:hypothetical protein
MSGRALAAALTASLALTPPAAASPEADLHDHVPRVADDPMPVAFDGQEVFGLEIDVEENHSLWT